MGDKDHSHFMERSKLFLRMTNESHKFLTWRSNVSVSSSHLKIKWLSLLFLVYYLLGFNNKACFSLKFCHKSPHAFSCKRHFYFSPFFEKKEVIFDSVLSCCVSLCIFKETNQQKYFTFPLS